MNKKTLQNKPGTPLILRIALLGIFSVALPAGCSSSEKTDNANIQEMGRDIRISNSLEIDKKHDDGKTETRRITPPAGTGKIVLSRPMFVAGKISTGTETASEEENRKTDRAIDKASPALAEMLKAKIPEIKMEELSLQQAVELVRKHSARLNENGRKINVLISPELREKNISITLTLREIPVYHALRLIAQSARLDIKIEPYAVLLIEKKNR